MYHVLSIFMLSIQLILIPTFLNLTTASPVLSDEIKAPCLISKLEFKSMEYNGSKQRTWKVEAGRSLWVSDQSGQYSSDQPGLPSETLSLNTKFCQV